jgi:hypothetical protein
VIQDHQQAQVQTRSDHAHSRTVGFFNFCYFMLFGTVLLYAAVSSECFRTGRRAV